MSVAQMGSLRSLLLGSAQLPRNRGFEVMQFVGSDLLQGQ